MQQNPNHNQPQMPQAAKITCTKELCKREFEAMPPLPPQFANGPVVCTVVVLHPEPFQCPGCGQWYNWQLATAQTRCIAMQFEPPTQLFIPGSAPLT